MSPGPKKETKRENDSSLSWQVQEKIEDIKKKFGEESVSTLEESRLKGRKALSTGSLLLNKLTNTGGYVCGTIVEIFGRPGIGKTTLALHAVRECQKLGKIAAYIDLENKLEKNAEYVKEIGVNTKELIVFRGQNGEKVFDFIDEWIEKGIGLFVVDSVAALVPSLEKSPKTQGIASKARLISDRMPTTNLKMYPRDAVIIFINQIRENPSPSYSGSGIVTPGGWALEFHSGLRIMLMPEERIKKDNEVIGMKIQATIVKSSFTGFPKKTSLEVIFGQGIQKEREIIDLATELNIIQKSGTWYSCQEKKLGQGKENAADYLQENPELYQKIEKDVLEAINANKQGK